MGHWEVEIVAEGKKRFSLGKIVSGWRPIWGSPRWGAVNTPTTLPVLRCTIYLWSDVCSDVLYLYSDVILRSRKGTIASNSHSGAPEWKGKGRSHVTKKVIIVTIIIIIIIITSAEKIPNQSSETLRKFAWELDFKVGGSSFAHSEVNVSFIGLCNCVPCIQGMSN